MKQLGAADPRQIGPYTLLGRLGAGGMGAVYLGRARGRTVAVKVVRPDLARDDAFRDRFQREVEAARLVSGAFTAPVVDADTQDRIPWMATTFVVGVSLDQAVTTRGPLPGNVLWALTAGVAEALAGVHDAGLIHRDLKPANVLLALDGPRVIDFGIARAVDGTALTSTGAIIGSAPYMSPEQAVGEPLSSASDVFSLGSAIAFAARGDSLFGAGAAAGVLFRIVHTEPDLGAVPAGLRDLIASCLAKNPGDRPTPRQVSECVEREGHPVPSGGWLPEAVAADIIAVRAVMTTLPEPPPTLAFGHVTQGPGSPAGGPESSGPESGRPEPRGAGADRPDADRSDPADGPDPAGRPNPNRRKLLLGLAGGTLAVAGAGTWLGLALSGSGAADDEPGGRPRPSGNDVPEATLAWKVKPSGTGSGAGQTKQSAACPQVLSTHGLVVCPTLERILALDDAGRTKWTVDGTEHGIAFSVQGSLPNVIAAADGDRLYVAGMAMKSMAVRSAVVAIDLDKGKAAWTATLDRPHTQGVLRFCGVMDGTAYLIGFGDGKDHGGPTPSGYHVWALDLTTRKTAFFHGEDADFIFSALPQRGDHALFAGPTRLRALDTKGGVAWTTKREPHTVDAAGQHFIVVDGTMRMSALDPATGKSVWTAAGAVAPASLRGNGIATDKDGRVLYALWQDKDNGYSLGALDGGTGRTRWKTPLPADSKDSRSLGARILYADGNLYRMGADSVVWACDATNGKPRWKYTGMKGTDPTKLAWTAGDGRLCLSDPTATTVAALHANGA
ncbi:PQQ-binding-like beta-propeller repeat protein [Streptomyces sp. NPDC058773]|uniref:serine/threonine-protein kinase n=1 Tax=Streptomyces sp. NPDC058773 TaxID=3346632 RepID=UPI0036937312